MAIILISFDDLVELVQVQLSSLSSYITEEGYILAGDQAGQELGWSYPITNPTQVFWMINRAVRHSLNILKIGAAYKFKYKQANLQNRFEHLDKIVASMDEDFEKAILFASVDSFKMFGTKIDAGFAYGIDGVDKTYEVDRFVNFAPSENA